MNELDELAGKIFSLLKGNGLKIKIFDNEGAETTDPTIGRRFFVIKPNIMVTIDEEGSRVEFSKGADIDETSNDVVMNIQKNIRKIADEFQFNSDIKVFGKSIQPRDYAYQAKMQKDPLAEAGMPSAVAAIKTKLDNSSPEELYNRFAELASKRNTSIEDIARSSAWRYGYGKMSGHYWEKIKHMVNSSKSVSEGYKTNSLMLSKVYHELDYAAGMTAEALANNIPGADLNDVQHALNALLDDDKVEIISYMGKQPVYGKTMTEAITESFSKMFGSLKTSQQTLENVKILVKHKTPVDENVRGARTRHISAIFLECDGERLRFPHNYLPGARAMAQHMAHGGMMSDKVGSYISENTGNLLKLQSFNRYVTTNKLINEDSSAIIDTVKENIETIRRELHKLTGVKTYETVSARIETFEREALEEDDTSGLKDLFTIRRFDEKFEEVLPIVKQLVQERDSYRKRIEESAANIVMLRRESINTTPMFEFASEHARLGFKLSELSLRMVENEELASFVNKIGTKLCKEGVVNDFEKAVLTQVLENIQVAKASSDVKKDIKESADLSAFFDKYVMNFF
jgi:hypothetical protein